MSSIDFLENKTFAEIKVGDTAVFKQRLEEKHLSLFAAVSGDVNPVHLDQAFAQTTPFKERIAHGMWSGALISAAIATTLPGPGTVYLGQTLKFVRPVKLGDTLTVTLEVKEKIEKKNRVILTCTVNNQDDKAVVIGEADVMAPSEKIKVAKPQLPEIQIAGNSV